MTPVAEEMITHLANFSRLEKAAAAVPVWLDVRRRAAMAQFEKAGYPTTKMEEWRFTNVAPLAKVPFVPGSLDEKGAAETAGRFSFAGEAAVELVFVNGRYSAALSKTAALPHGVRVTSLADAVHGNEAWLEGRLGGIADTEANPFIALNTGFLDDGAVVHLGRGAVVDRPIHLLFISVSSSQPTINHPRVLVVAEEGSMGIVVESYVGAGGRGREGGSLTNSVTEILVGADARLDHCRLQQETLDASHLSATKALLEGGATFITHSATMGGKLTRNELEVVLDGERAEATLNGLVLIGGEQHCDNHTLLRHEKPNCPSHELYKHVLGDRATGVFKGKIYVQKHAIGTDSKQTSKSLLLSDAATMNSMPALEIYADDVKCTHGSTTGPLEEEMVFYLRSRGIGLEAARHLLTYAFAADVTRRIRVEPVRRRIEDFMAAQHGLPQDLRITDLGAHDEAAL